MRILHITPAFQHPHVRGSLRHYYFLRELSERHEITLLALTRTPIPSSVRADVEALTERALVFGPEHPPDGRVARELATRRAVGEMRRAFHELAARERFDVVLFHGKSVYRVISGWSGLPIVVDFCDATSMRLRQRMQHASLARRPLVGLRYAQIRRLEHRLAAQSEYRAFISVRDREAVLGPADRSAVVPNGVDLDYWTRRAGTPGDACVVFTGVMDYAPNEDAALYLIDRIVPLARRERPDLELLIVGRNPSRELRDRARAAGVTVTGAVEDMRDYLERAAVCIAPLRYASGMQNKALEAMAMQVPVLATSVVSDGLALGDGTPPPVVTADGEERLAAELVELLRDTPRRDRLAREGRSYVEQHFSWAAGARTLEELCSSAIAKASSDLDSRTPVEASGIAGRRGSSRGEIDRV
jgi:glycosyltransferase involved in cell wall biosynthesis